MFEAVNLSPDGSRLLAIGRSWTGEVGGTDWTISYNGLTLFETPGWRSSHISGRKPTPGFWVLRGRNPCLRRLVRAAHAGSGDRNASIDIDSGAVVAEGAVPTCAPRLLAPFGP
jgi:hypothetical protein